MNKILLSVSGIVLMLMGTHAGAAPGGAAELETRVEELEDRLNALESVIEIDENGDPGATTYTVQLRCLVF